MPIFQDRLIRLTKNIHKSTLSFSKNINTNPCKDVGDKDKRCFPKSVRLLMVPYEQLRKPIKLTEFGAEWFKQQRTKTNQVSTKQNQSKVTFTLEKAKRYFVRKCQHKYISTYNYKEPQYSEGEMVCEKIPQGQDALYLGDRVVTACEGKVGPGASKSSIYKNPEYYCYHPYSYYNLQLEMKNVRLPQPSNKST